MQSPPDITWVILAGGKGARMGGEDKGLLLLQNIPLIEYILHDLRAQGASKIAINANRHLERYQHYAPVFSDLTANFSGPLAGMQAAMHYADTDWLGFVPCDTPRLPPHLLRTFYQHIRPESEILVAHDGEHIQPVFCLLKRSILPRLTAFLARGDKKIILLYNECHTTWVHFNAQEDAFINLNTPDELTQYGNKL